MIIEDNRIDFGCLNVGECFKYDDNIYLKTEDICLSEITYNAVNLECGAIESFDNYDVVIRLKHAKIVIS